MAALSQDRADCVRCGSADTDLGRHCRHSARIGPTKLAIWALSVSKLLREALQLDKDVLIDRSHRSLAPRKPGGKPRAIVAKLHYFQDCVEVLNRARTRAPIRYNGESIAIFPDYTSRVAKARAAFTEVRKLLRNRQNVRFGILFPARLRVTHNGEEKEFTDAEKAMTYVRKHIIPAEERE